LWPGWRFELYEMRIRVVNGQVECWLAQRPEPIWLVLNWNGHRWRGAEAFHSVLDRQRC
jgi:hypothetical protein